MPKFKIKFKKIGYIIKKLPRTLSEHTFFALLVFLLISFVLGGMIFYKYIILIETFPPAIGEEFFRFDQNTYQKVLSEWELRNKKTSEIDSEKYLNPFRSAISTQWLTSHNNRVD